MSADKFVIPTRAADYEEESHRKGASEPERSAEQALLENERRKLANKEKMKAEDPDEFNRIREEQRQANLKQALDDRDFLSMPGLM